MSGKHDIRIVACALLALFTALVVGCGASREISQLPRESHIDHAVLTRLLERYVDETGRVNYPELPKDQKLLLDYVVSLGQADLASMNQRERLATRINAYNAFTLALMLEYPEADSIRDIPEEFRWKHRRWLLGGEIVSLDQLEHEIIRPSTDDARIHFALVCASEGCPPLRREAFAADALDRQLEEQAAIAHSGDRWFRYDADRNELWLTPLYAWYSKDFERDAGSVLAFVARYSPEVREMIADGRPPSIRWMEYDWSLNASGTP